MDIDVRTLNSQTGFSITSSSYRNNAKINYVGDINKDGYDDFLFTSDTNVCNLIFGHDKPFVNIDVDTLSMPNGFKIHYCYDVGCNGDFNGDGYNDILVSTDYYYVYANMVIFGKASGFGDIFLNQNFSASDGFMIDGAGIITESAGDINNDGYDEIIISTYTPPKVNYILFGKPTFPSYIDLFNLSINDGFKINNALNFGQIAGAGDINNDGYDDIIIGDASDSDFSSVYVIFGKASGFSDIGDLTSLNSSQRWKITGATTNDIFGVEVCGNFDFNNDGYSDIAVSANFGVYMFFGKASGFVDINVNTMSSSDGFKITGESYIGYSGGDINNDGFSEVFLGDYRKLYVLFGKASNFSSVDLGNLDNSIGFKIFGSNNGLSPFYSDGLGDLNHDNYSDILAGYVLDSGIPKGYVIYGGPQLLTDSPSGMNGGSTPTSAVTTSQAGSVSSGSILEADSILMLPMIAGIVWEFLA